MNLFERLLKKNIQKKSSKSKQKLNNQGNSFVLVLVSIALIMIVLAIVVVMMFMQYKMIRLGRQSKNNFYYLEEVLDEMRAGVGNKSINALKAAYDDTVSMVVFYDDNQGKYMSVSSDTAETIMDNKFFNNIEAIYNKPSRSALEAEILAYVQNVHISATQNITDQGVKIEFGTNFKCEAIKQTSPVRTIGYRISDITVSRVDSKGNDQSISTDITIYPPEQALNFLGSSLDVENLFTYSMVADYGLEVNGPGIDARIVGNVYAASDYRNNGVYHGHYKENGSAGAAGSVAAKKYIIENATPYVYDVADQSANPGVSQMAAGKQAKGDHKKSLYSGILVSGNNTLNLQSDIIAINGSIAADNNAKIVGNTKATETSRAYAATLFANNIVTTKDGANAADKTETTIDLRANSHVSDDIELNAQNSNVRLTGTYYGYNYEAEEEWKSEQSGYTKKGQVSTYSDMAQKPYEKEHTNSSAIIVNGENSKLDLSGLTTMLVNGRSYVDLVAEQPAAATNSTEYSDFDVKTAESVSAKGTQLAYRVTEPSSISSSLLSLDTQGTKAVGSDAHKLAKKVPTYNLIRFLTYQFIKNRGFMIYRSAGSNSLHNSNWDDIKVSNDPTETEVTTAFNTVMDDIVANGTGSKFYKDIMDVYFPSEYLILPKLKSDGKYADNGKNQLSYIKVYPNNLKNPADFYEEITDTSGNTYSIPRTRGYLELSDGTKYGNAYASGTSATNNDIGNIVTRTDTNNVENVKEIHRYGFVTVGDKYELINLAKAVVGASKSVYYYYQFYDESGKEAFTLDYADYSSSAQGSAVDDITSTDLFASDISLPENNGINQNYTRGIATSVDAKASKYKLTSSLQEVSRLYADEAEVDKAYQNDVDNARVFMCYFPKAIANITRKSLPTDDYGMVDYAQAMYQNKTNTLTNVPASESSFTYSTSGRNISPLTNIYPQSVPFDWYQVDKKNNVTAGQNGQELDGYPGAYVWVSPNDITIDGNDSRFNGKIKGIVITMGSVTFKNVDEFTGTVIAAGKVKITCDAAGKTTKFLADEKMCNNLLQNDINNQIRTCFGLDEYTKEDVADNGGASVSSIEYTDIVGYENWKKNDK